MLKSVNEELDTFFYDQHGFRVDQNNILSLSNEKTKKLKKRDLARVQKWLQMQESLTMLISKNDEKLKQRIRKGIPEDLRGIIWLKLVDIDDEDDLVSIANYKDIQQQLEDNVVDDILKDLNRTFPTNLFFENEKGSPNYIIQSLGLVLSAFAQTYPEIGYCQGLNFVCAMLLLYVNDQPLTLIKEAYSMLVSMAKRYRIMEVYKNPLFVAKYLKVVSQLMKEFLPKVIKRLIVENIDLLMVCSGWVISFFLNHLPFKTALRIFDIFLYEGNKIIYRAILAIFAIKEEKILKAQDSSDILQICRNTEEEYQDDDYFIKKCCKFSFSRKYSNVLFSYTNFFNSQQQKLEDIFDN